MTKELTPSNLAAYEADHPEVRRLHQAQSDEFRRRLGELQDGMPSLLRGFTDKSEQARQIGIVLLEFVDTLPGKRLTLDFYEQCRDLFVDGHGQTVPLHILEAFMRSARRNENPITTVTAALDCQQLLLYAGGSEFALAAETQRQPPMLHPPPNPLFQLKEAFLHLQLKSIVDDFRGNPGFCPGGRPRPDLAAGLRVELKDKLIEFDEVRQWLRVEIGI